MSSRKFRFFLKESLGLKVLVSFILVIVIVLSAFTLFAVVHEGNKAKSDLREQGEMLSGLLGHGSMTGVFAEDRKMLASVAEGAIGQKDVVSVSIYNADLKLLYSSVKTPSGKDVLSVSENEVRNLRTALAVSVSETGRTFEFLRPVTIRSASASDESLYFGGAGESRAEKVIGYVRVVLSKNSYHKEILALLVRNAVIMLIFVFSSIVITHLAVKKITGPLKKLTESVKALEKGMPIEQVPVETMDEVGNLASAFNAMVLARGQAEESLRQSEQRFRLIAETIQEVFWIADVETTKTVYVSPGYERVWGRSTKSLYEDPWSFFDAVHEEDSDRVLNALERKKLGQLYEAEYRILRPEGSIRLIWDRGYPVRDGTGRVVCYVGVAQDITERRGMEEKIQTYQRELRAAALEMSSMEARIEERERHLIAADLHDFVGQNLVVTQFKLAALQKTLSSPELIRRVEEIRELTRQTIQYTRSLTVELSPPILVEIGFKAALEALAEGFQKTHKIPIRVEDDGRPEQPDDDIRYLLFRSVRELLMNIVKHSQASMVKIAIARQNETIVVSVEDNGIGFEPAKVAGKDRGFGLFTIHRRLKHSEGCCEVVSRPGSGTRVVLSAPLK
jgi:PAS domain S-box-containing protein